MTYVTWWDMAGCNSFASWIPMLAKKCKKQLFYFSTFAHLQWNKINAKRSIYFTFILFYVRCADGTSLALYKIRNMAEFKPLLGRPRPSFDSFCSTGPPQGSPTAQSATQLFGTNSPGPSFMDQWPLRVLLLYSIKLHEVKFHINAGTEAKRISQLWMNNHEYSQAINFNYWASYLVLSV